MDVAALQLSAAEFQLKLDTLYASMLDQCRPYIGLGQAVGSIGALLYISSRVWGHLARAEAIDLFPLLRPFLIGLCILLFPQLCSALYGVTHAVAHSADSVRQQQQQQIADLSQRRDALALQASQQQANYQPDAEKDREIEGLAGGSSSGSSMGGMALSAMGIDLDAISYKIDKEFREWTKNMLELGAVAAQLGLSLIATFLLLMLSIIGPLAFGIAILPGFGGGIRKWFGNFITISLWLPVATIYGTILGSLQIQLLNNDIAQLSSSGSTDSSDIAYLCFLLLAIVGYLFVPKATELIVDHSGVGTAASGVAQGVAAGVGGYAGAAAGVATRTGLGATQGLLGAAPGSGNQNPHVSPAQAFGHRVGSSLRGRFGS